MKRSLFFMVLSLIACMQMGFNFGFSPRDTSNVGPGVDTSINNYYNKLYAASMQGKFDTSEIWSDSAWAYYEKYPTPYNKAIALNCKAELLYDANEYTEAIQLYEKAIKIAKSLEIVKLKARLHSALGRSYQNILDYKTALEHHYKAQILFENLGDSAFVSDIYHNIGGVYQRQRRYKKALDYYKRSLELDKEIGRLEGRGATLHNIGALYQIMEDYPSALEYYHKAALAAKRENSFYHRAYFLNSMARLQVMMGIDVQAQKNFKRSIFLADSLQSVFLKASAQSFYADYLQSKGRLFEAERLLKKSFLVFDSLDTYHELMECHQQLSGLFAQKGQFSKAYTHHQRYAHLMDSLFDEKNAVQLGRLEAKFQFEQEQREEKLAMQERMETAKKEQRRRNNLQYLGIGGLILLSFVILYFFGRLSIPYRFIDLFIFASFLLVFEFLLILTEPTLETYANQPIYKFVYNFILAAVLTPLHHQMEKMARTNFKKQKRKTAASSA